MPNILNRLDIIAIALGLALILLLLTFPARAQSITCIDLGGGVTYCTTPSGSSTCVTSIGITTCS